MQRDLSACIVQKFNGYEILKIQLKGIEKRNHELIDIIYEPVNDERHINLFFLLMTFILLTDLIILKKKEKETTRFPIPLQGNVTIAISVLSDTKVGFMIM